MISNKSNLGLLKLFTNIDMDILLENNDNPFGSLDFHLIDEPQNPFKSAFLLNCGNLLDSSDSINYKYPFIIKPRYLSIDVSGKYLNPVLEEMIPSWNQFKYNIILTSILQLPSHFVLFELYNGFDEQKQGLTRRRYFKNNPDSVNNWDEIQDYCKKNKIDIY